MMEINLRGVVYCREGKGREGRRDFRVFRALEKGCGGVHVGGCAGESPRKAEFAVRL